MVGRFVAPGVAVFGDDLVFRVPVSSAETCLMCDEDRVCKAGGLAHDILGRYV